MSKKIKGIGYSVAVEYKEGWRVTIYRACREQYFYPCSSKEEAIEKYNNIN